MIVSAALGEAFDGRPEYLRAYRKANRDALRAKRVAYLAAGDNHAKHVATVRKWRSENREGEIIRDLRRSYRRYAMIEAEYFAMLEAQGGRCASCGDTDPHSGRGRRFDVDHDHAKCVACKASAETGKKVRFGHGPVRALLCHPCNSMLGHAHDEIDRLLKGAAYLERHGKVRS